MPDLPGRRTHEQAVAAAILLLFDEWKDRIGKRWPSPIAWDSMQSAISLSPDLRAALIAIYLAAIGASAVGAGVASVPDLSSKAIREVADYQSIIAAAIVDNTEASLRSLGPAASPQAVAQVTETILGQDRADKIGVTETTRMTSAGEAAFWAWMETSDTPVRFMAVWRTAEDERVCPRCSKFDGLTADKWNGPPPLHVYCRCYVDYIKTP